MGTGQKEVLWNSGENVSELDLNNSQRFLRAFMCDWLLGTAGSFDADGSQAVPRDLALFVLGDSCAPYPSTTALRVDSLGGPILQWKSGISDPFRAMTSLPANWGTDPYAMVYWATPNELQTTHSAGHPTLDRWDILSVKLDDVSNDVADQETRLSKQVVGSSLVISSGSVIKRRKVTLLKQLVAGTPSATPAIPPAPAGYVVLYAVRVPATFAGVFPVDNDFHDYRMPLGSFSVEMQGWQASQGGAAPTTPISGALRGVSIGASDSLDFVPNLPVSESACRLIFSRSLNGQATSVTATYGRYNPLNGGSYNQHGGALSTSFWGPIASAAGNNSNFRWTSGHSDVSNIPNSLYDPGEKPVWGTGWPSGYAARHFRATGDNVADTVGIRFATGGGGAFGVAKVRFIFAGMPF